MNHLYAPVIFGLAASLCWGSGDFSGGLASRSANVGSVVLTDYVVGLVLLVALALIGKEPVPAHADLLWGGLAGVAGVIGLLSFYAALARGKMGIAAPVSAVLTAALPVLWNRVHGRGACPAATGWLCAGGACDWTDLLAAAHDRTPNGHRTGRAFWMWLRLLLHPHQPGASRHYLLVAILSSLYPAATVGLSVLVLRERVTHVQTIGVLLVLLAIPVISA